jgi:hypothetical protein
MKILFLLLCYTVGALIYDIKGRCCFHCFLIFIPWIRSFSTNSWNFSMLLDYYLCLIQWFDEMMTIERGRLWIFNQDIISGTIFILKFNTNLSSFYILYVINKIPLFVLCYWLLKLSLLLLIPIWFMDLAR